MEQRLKKLTETIQFKAALYFDPRFNYIGSGKIITEDKEAVQRFLLTLWTRLNAIDSTEEDEEPASSDASTETNSFIKQYLDTYFQKDAVVEDAPVTKPLAKIHRLIKELEFQPKVLLENQQFDVMKYWMKQRTGQPELYRLAMVVLSAPSTQVIIERSFSALKLILSDLRQRLSDPRIQDLMILKLNPDLLPRVVQILDNEI
ncbi:uncharacterized protein LOC120413688 [Culex pipiens pallens]|nr:uncharacterized protein LOC120413688 [Culex pipiens pallens]